jgi:hypothetical protein
MGICMRGVVVTPVGAKASLFWRRQLIMQQNSNKKNNHTVSFNRYPSRRPAATSGRWQ